MPHRRGLVLPGGVVNADEWRMAPAAVTLVQRPLRVPRPTFTVRAQGLYSAPIRAAFEALAVPKDVRS